MELCMRTQIEGADDIPRYVDHLRGASFETAWTELSVLPLSSSMRGAQVAVPIDVATRQRLDDIEEFVRSNVIIPADLQAYRKSVVYKSLYRGPSMYMKIHPDCTCFVFDVNCRSIQMEVDEDVPCFSFHLPKPFDMIPVKDFKNRRARYRFKVNLSTVYIGPHVNGSLVSLIPSIDAIFVDS